MSSKTVAVLNQPVSEMQRIFSRCDADIEGLGSRHGDNLLRIDQLLTGEMDEMLTECSRVVMVMVVIGAVIAGTRAAGQRPLQIGGNRLVGIGFRSHQSHDALGGKPLT